MMKLYSAADVHSALEWTTLTSALAAAFAAGAVVPLRHVHALNADDLMLLMPAWNADVIGLKLVTVLPGAHALGAPTVGATYVLLDRASGVPRAVLDGDALTVRRTAAVSEFAPPTGERRAASRHFSLISRTILPYSVR